MNKQDKLKVSLPWLAGLVLGLALTAEASAPPGRYTITTDTVFDTVTGLTWQRNISPTQYTWANATTYCQNLNLGGAVWRLPTIKELQSLVDIRASNPAIDLTAFPAAPAAGFWSSTQGVDPGAPAANAWLVNFANGSTPALLLTNTARVRCVR